jgi:hypothetical protein
MVTVTGFREKKKQENESSFVSEIQSDVGSKNLESM